MSEHRTRSNRRYADAANNFRTAVVTFILAAVMAGAMWWFSRFNVSDTMKAIRIVMCLIILMLIGGSISCVVSAVTSYMAAKDDERDAVLEMLNQIRWDIEKGDK